MPQPLPPVDRAVQLRASEKPGTRNQEQGQALALLPRKLLVLQQRLGVLADDKSGTRHQNTRLPTADDRSMCSTEGSPRPFVVYRCCKQAVTLNPPSGRVFLMGV